MLAEAKAVLAHKIKNRELRVITVDGENLGVIKTEEALKIAIERGLDLIVVSPNAEPPVAKILDFKKFLYQEQKKTGKASTPSELIWKMGEKINNKESIYYWAWRNKIRVYCPAISDGALGDNIYFFSLG